jgi:hypothetical protein
MMMTYKRLLTIKIMISNISITIWNMWSIIMWSMWLLKTWKHDTWSITARQDIYLITAINMRQHVKRRDRTTETYRQQRTKQLDWINETSRHGIYLIVETNTRYKEKRYDWIYETNS